MSLFLFGYNADKKVIQNAQICLQILFKVWQMVQQAQPSSSGSAPDCDQPEQLLQEAQAYIAARPDIDSLHSLPKFSQDKETQCCIGATLSKSVGNQTVVSKPLKTCDVSVQLMHISDGVRMCLCKLRFKSSRTQGKAS